MELEREILREHSKRQTVRIARWVGRDKRRFKQLMELFLHGDRVVTQRSAWIMSHCAERHPELMKPWMKALIDKMQEPGVHDAVKRNGLRIFQCADIPKSLLGKVVSLSFDNISALNAPIAVKAYSIGIILNVSKREPDLGRELRSTIEQMMPFVGPALQARGRMVLKQLRADSKQGEGSLDTTQRRP